MRTHGAAARRGKSVGLARLRILGRPTASSASHPTSGPEKKKQDNKKRPVPALLPERAPLFCGFSHLVLEWTKQYFANKVLIEESVVAPPMTSSRKLM